MDREEIKKRYELCNSDSYKEIRKRVLEYVIEFSTNSLMRENIMGMLITIKEIDSWEELYLKELEKANAEREGN